MKRRKAKADNLLNRGGKWVYRVYYRINGVKKEKQIPLRTPSLVTARKRSFEVLKKLRDIKLNLINSNGEDYGFVFFLLGIFFILPATFRRLFTPSDRIGF